ncbi:hypothetical protein HELRODRAFT_184455, partial [Helobdella robusta]|uniref:Uncharacterized protein n=1 Tax=Helobdella robusta TaxID=6412 RepID=T1FL86_HELRO
GTRLADLSWAIVENKLDQQPLQENLVNVKTIIDQLTRDAPEEGRRELSELLNNFQDIFSHSGTEIGVAKGVYHRINTEQARPIKQQLRRHPPAHQKVIAKQVDEIVVKLVTKISSERQLCQIYSSVKVQIPARAEIDVPTKLVVRQPSKLTLTDCACPEAGQVTSGVFVARTLLLIKYEGQCVRILNVNDESRLIKQGTRLADLSWAIVENKLDQQPLQENLVNVKTIIDQLTRDAPEEGRRELSELLNNFQDIFSHSGTEIGVAKGVYHRINTEQARPIKQQLRRHPPAHQKVIAKQKQIYNI